MLFWKFKMGLFDDPYVDPDEAERVVGCDAHRELALQAARETITLLKNEGDLLPLDPMPSSKPSPSSAPTPIAVCWAATAACRQHDVTVLDGIRARVGKRVESALQRRLQNHHRRLLATGRGHPQRSGGRSQADRRGGEGRPSAPTSSCSRIGGNEQTSREAWSLKHLGDRASLELVGRQEELVKAMLATGKPVVVLLFNGRPLSINIVSRNVPAIFECWYLGQETGHAVAEVLFGDFNPGGKLPISIPRSAGHCRPTTITSPPPAAAICSTMSRRCTPSATA